MKYSGKTDIGLKRKNNQDSYAVFSREGYLCAVVCDGMGGAKGGNVASGLAVKSFSYTVKKFFESRPPLECGKHDITSLLRDAVDNANETVYLKSISDEELDGMGTTLAAVICCCQGCFAVNVGDSRIYKQNDNGFTQVSKDHSFVQYLLEKGEITAAEAAIHPNKNIILRAVGVNEHVEGDYFVIDDFKRILLCSDGLTNHVPDERIASTIQGENLANGKKSSLKSRVEKLIFDANNGGGSDNITAVLIEKDQNEQ